MIHVRLPELRERRLPFYLAMEEWVVLNMPVDDYIFAWRVAPTVICGRNQDIALEVDLEYCRQNGIDVVRRRSGGGCVYADMDNYMFSFIAPGDNVDENYGRYTSITAALLCSIGLPAKVSGRNDLLIDGHKIAGNAFYRLAGRSIVHGTMLYSFNPERLAHAITPSKAKLLSKGVVSAPARVTCLKNLGISMSVEEFGAYAIEFFTQGKHITLTENQVKEIEALEQRYYEPTFLWGRHAKTTITTERRRIEGIGELYAEIAITTDKTIENLRLRGDYFFSADVEKEIEHHFTGIKYSSDAIKDTIYSINPQKAIPGLTHSQLFEIIS